MLYKDVVAVDAEIDGLLQAAFGHDHVVEGMALPVFFAQHPHIEQHPAVQQIFAPHQRRKLFLHFIHLAGGKEAAAANVDAEDGLLVLKRKVRLMQDGAVAADGQDNIGTREALFQRKVLHPIGAAGFVQVIPHQDGGPLHQQELRCLLGGGHRLLFAGVWRNVNGHMTSPSRFICPASYGLRPRPARRRNHPARRAARSSGRTSDTRCSPPGL